VTSIISKPLDTRRLYLRQPTEQDAEAISAIAGDWEVARRLGRMPHPYTDTHYRFFLDHVVPNEPTWVILWRQTESIIGVIGLKPDADGESAELGYYIDRNCWGRGVATEAARAVVQAGISSLGYRKLKSGYHMDNPASGCVLRKVGFTVVGTSNRPCLAEGRDKPSVEVALIP
jgi:RimJ/RimL family protein N-acetyltransferase